jgi:hypothetical protein
MDSKLTQRERSEESEKTSPLSRQSRLSRPVDTDYLGLARTALRGCLLDVLRQMEAEEVSVRVDGNRLAIEPAISCSEGLRAEILRHEAELSELFRDPPSWPPVRGRSGTLENWSHVVGDGVRTIDGRDGRLRAILYDTRSGRLRCRVELSDGTAVLMDPEDVLPAIMASLVAGRRG